MDVSRLLLSAALVAGTVSALARPTPPSEPSSKPHAATPVVSHALPLMGVGSSGEPGHALAFTGADRRPAPGPRGVPVAKLDRNGDGFVSREEQQAFRQQRHERREAVGDRRQHRSDQSH